MRKTRKLWLCTALLVCSAAFLLAMAGTLRRSRDAAPVPMMVLQAGRLDSLPQGMEFVPVGDGRQALSIPENALEDGNKVGAASLPFRTDRADTMHLWLRTRWNDGCGNTVCVQLDQAEPTVAGNDGTYRVWHWVKVDRVRLPSGDHMFRLIPREDGVAVDQILFTPDGDYWPSGALSTVAAPTAQQSPARD